MRFKVRTSDVKRQELVEKDWHLWFAWHPVRLDSHTIVWLERVQRKATISWVWCTLPQGGGFKGTKINWEYDW